MSNYFSLLFPRTLLEFGSNSILIVFFYSEGLLADTVNCNSFYVLFKIFQFLLLLLVSFPGVLPYIDYIGMCDPKGYGFSAVLVINRVSILADFGHFGCKWGMVFAL